MVAALLTGDDINEFVAFTDSRMQVLIDEYRLAVEMKDPAKAYLTRRIEALSDRRQRLLSFALDNGINIYARASVDDGDAAIERALDQLVEEGLLERVDG